MMGTGAPTSSDTDATINGTLRPPALVREEVEKTRGEKGGVVAAELEYRRPAALPALHCRGAREAGPLGGWPATRCDPAPFLMPLLIPPGLVRPARSVGGLRRGATRLRSSCPFSFHQGSRGRPARWVACDEVRPGSVPHAPSHSTRAREAGPLGGWPATRCDPAPFLMPLLIPPGLARPARSVGGLRRGATRLRSSCPFSFHQGS